MHSKILSIFIHEKKTNSIREFYMEMKFDTNSLVCPYEACTNPPVSASSR